MYAQTFTQIPGSYDFFKASAGLQKAKKKPKNKQQRTDNPQLKLDEKLSCGVFH